MLDIGKKGPKALADDLTREWRNQINGSQRIVFANEITELIEAVIRRERIEANARLAQYLPKPAKAVANA